MIKKIIPITFIAFFLMLSSTFALEYTTSEMTKVKSTEAFCYGTDTRDVIEYAFDNGLDSYCTTNITLTPPPLCLRNVKIDNLDDKKSEITVQVLPALIGMCPPPTKPTINNVFVTFAPNGDQSKAQTQVFDMNKCWGWWCAGTTYVNKTVCPFNLMFLEAFRICKNVNTTMFSEMQNCPEYTFKISPSTNWINASWTLDPSNSWMVDYYRVGFITFSTSQKIKVVQTDYEKIITTSPSYQPFYSAIGMLMEMNSSFLTIVFRIAEIIILIGSVILVPALALLLIKWIWEKITGRPLGFGKRRS
jgi:hypothetical protein